MKRFKGLVIENFQSHERTEIAFSKGLNVFVGPSDSGKSAILRALRWVLYNQPRGSDFIRTGASRCRVTLILSDGTQIVRERSSSVNRYLIRDPRGKEQVFEGFGSDVPREVLEAHGMVPLQLDEDRELTLQIGQQLEGPFLLSESGGTRAKSIGRISGAHLLDLAQNQTAKDQRAVSSRIRFVEEEMERREEELKPYEVLPRLRKQLDRAAALREEAERKKEFLERLRGLKERWEGCRSEMLRERKRLSSLEKVPEAEKIFSRLVEDGTRLIRIRKMADGWRKGREEKAHWQQVRFRTTRLGEGAQRIAEAERLLERLDRLRRLRNHRLLLARDMDRERRVVERTVSLPAAGLLVDDLGEAVRKLRKLEERRKRWVGMRGERAEVERTLRRLEEAQKAEALWGGLEASCRLFQSLKERRDRLEELRERIEKGMRYIAEREEEIRRKSEEMIRAFERMGRCPTCGMRFGPDLLKHLSEELQGGESGAAAGKGDSSASQGFGRGERSAQPGGGQAGVAGAAGKGDPAGVGGARGGAGSPGRGDRPAGAGNR
ncbi:MAG: AAA family ATPase [Planifilum fimeticola]